MKLPTTKELAEGIYLTECSPISQKDFARAREALIKADISKDHKLYLLSDGGLVAIKNDEVKVLSYVE